jgi:uncharacterized small protein (DUF1192 family)
MIWVRFVPSITVLLGGLLSGQTGALSMAKDKEPVPVPWSFAPLRSVELPGVRNADWPRNRIDWFILAGIEAAGLNPAPEADAHTLRRRLAFDLTGLPPTDGGAGDLEAEVDRLLASPHYGERWGRHWLDLARYADNGATTQASSAFAYLYRDWVVRALNDDMPYDEFILRQLATDYLPEQGPEDLPALGFIGLGPVYFKELQLPPDIIKTTVADEWEERVDAVGRTFLGLTLACARCHDHKSDPVTMADYYALAGVFASVKLSDRPMVSDEIWAPVARARDLVAKLEKDLADLRKAKLADLKERSAALAEEIERVKAATPHYHMAMANAVEDAALYVVEADNKKGTKLEYKTGMARDLELHKRGDPNDTGEVVERRFLSAFPAAGGGPRRFTEGSGRLDLARALIDEAGPLTARVMVNRVWKQHFGRGLVDTPSEFGNLGDAPTHPDLLEDLAGRFIANGWSLKWLHREILNSATWRQGANEAADEADPDNRLFARVPRRRLEWEAWRDALMSAAGTLDLTLGGVSQPVSDGANRRRSLYSLLHRGDMDPMLRIHDVPDPGAHSPWRNETMTPLQGLFALNSPFVLQQADALGEHLQGLPEPSAGRVAYAYRRLFQRLPTDREMRAAAGFLKGSEGDGAAWSAYAQALLVSNEMLFVD